MSFFFSSCIKELNIQHFSKQVLRLKFVCGPLEIKRRECLFHLFEQMWIKFPK